MGNSVTSRRAALLVAFMAFVQFILQMSLLARGEEYAAVSLMIDDTYYYLQTAWNTKQLGFVTFDGLHSTNGVQLLWFLLILLLTLLLQTKTALLFATLILTFLLNCLSYLFILKIGVALKRPALALLIAGLWALQSLPFRVYSMGMENSLHALILWCMVWQATLFLVRVQNGLKPNFWGLTAVLILNAWTRLDSALLSLTVYVFCLAMFASHSEESFKQFLQRHVKVIAGTALFATAALFTQLAAFWYMGGSFLPVSALVKSSSESRGLGAESLDKFIEVLMLGMPSIVQGRLSALILALGGLIGILIVLRGRKVRNHSREMRAFLDIWLCLLLSELVYHAIVGVSGQQYTPYFVWYRSPSFIFWILTASLATHFLLDTASSFQRIRNLNWAPIVLSFIFFTTALYMFARSLNFTSQLYVARYETALWIAENAPPDAIYAAWNTGQLSYFSNRTFINLDGVINSVDYYERILRGATPLTDYLTENDVDYIVDYAIYDSIPAYRVVHAFPINDRSGRSIKIWQVSPQISTAQ